MKKVSRLDKLAEFQIIKITQKLWNFMIIVLQVMIKIFISNFETEQ